MIEVEAKSVEVSSISNPNRVADAQFDTSKLTANLERRTVTGTAAVLAAQGIKVLMQAGSMVILARLLTPVDYGAFGIISAVTGLGLVIKDMGLAAATLNSADLSQTKVSNVFWLTLTANALLAMVTCAVAPVIGAIYRDMTLILPIVAMSSSFIILAFGSQHYSLLRRQMRFKTLAVVDIGSLACAIAVAVFTAQSGGAVWALVNMQVTLALLSSALVWLSCKWRPSLPDRSENIAELRRFGNQIVSFQLLDYAIRSTDNLLIGKFCGAQALGLYDRAFQLHMIPAQNICWPFGAVLLGTLSRARGDKTRFSNFAAMTVFATSAICMPMIAFLFVKTPEIISILLGPQWMDSSNLFRALAPAAFFECVLLSLGWIFMAADEGGRLLKCNVYQFVLTILSFFVGIRWGALGVALALSVTRMVSIFPTLIYCNKSNELSVRALLASFIEPMGASIISAAVMARCLNLGASATSLIMDLGLFSLLYASILLSCPSGQKLLKQLGLRRILTR